MRDMDIVKNWPKIRKHFNQSFRTSFHVSVASICSDNQPTITPIGSLFLNQDQTGFYFEKFPTKLPKYAHINNKVCVLGVNSSQWFWLWSLMRGKFGQYPAIKLYGKLGKNRPATEPEVSRLRMRMKATNGTKGNKYLWSDMDSVREVEFQQAEMINLGKMTIDL